jgi:hypothetical protein
MTRSRRPRSLIRVRTPPRNATSPIGLTHGLLSFAVLIVPTSPLQFFPTRPQSIHNMAEYDLAVRYFKLLPIPVPILLIGLLPEN